MNIEQRWSATDLTTRKQPSSPQQEASRASRSAKTQSFAPSSKTNLASATAPRTSSQATTAFSDFIRRGQANTSDSAPPFSNIPPSSQSHRYQHAASTYANQSEALKLTTLQQVLGNVDYFV